MSVLLPLLQLLLLLLTHSVARPPHLSLSSLMQDAVSDLIESRWCVSAAYGVYPNLTVSVLNRDRGTSVDGPVTEIAGWADFAPPGSPVGELTVHLQGVPVAAPYWITSLGPENANNGGLYDWAVVTDPFQMNLFVLARNVTYFYANYNASVYTMLLNEGFNGPLNSPVPTNQIGCPPWPV